MLFTRLVADPFRIVERAQPREKAKNWSERVEGGSRSRLLLALSIIQTGPASSLIIYNLDCPPITQSIVDLASERKPVCTGHTNFA